jgi:benzoyl-CoA reductase subunit B
VQKFGAEGVVFAAPSFCDPALLERPMLQDVLSKHKIPHTAFKYSENTGQMAADPRTGGHVRRFHQAVGCSVMHNPTKRKGLTDDHSHDCLASFLEEAAERPEGGRDVAAEGDDQPQLLRAGERARDQPQGRSTFVPGNLNELLMCFDFARSLPETNALQNGMRKKSGKMIMDAERDGQSEDVCTYVKADLGMMLGGEIGPTGEALPRPDMLLLSYTGCFTFMKWFELIRHKYGCETVMLHVPYQGDGRITPEHARVRRQAAEGNGDTDARAGVGVKFDIDRLREYMRESAKAEEDLVAVLHSAKHRPSPIDGYFGAVYYIGPIFTAFRGTPEATEYYRVLRGEIEQRMREGKGPVTPEGEMGEEKYRLIVEGPPNWTSFRDFWKMFYDEGAVVVSSTYAKVGGVYDFGFRHDPENPIESLADYCLGCYTNLNLPSRDRHDLPLHRRVPGRRPADQLDQELQQLLRRPAADPARGGEADRQAGRVHRDRSGRSALLLRRQRQEPARELLPDGQAEAHVGATRGLAGVIPIVAH